MHINKRLNYHFKGKSARVVSEHMLAYGQLSMPIVVDFLFQQPGSDCIKHVLREARLKPKSMDQSFGMYIVYRVIYLY